MKKVYEITEEDFPEFTVVSVRAKDSLGAMGKYIGALKWLGHPGRSM